MEFKCIHALYGVTPFCFTIIANYTCFIKMGVGPAGQFLSNMLRRLFVPGCFLLFGGLTGCRAGQTADLTSHQTPSSQINCTDQSSSYGACDLSNPMDNTSTENHNVKERRNSKRLDVYGLENGGNDAVEASGRKKKGGGGYGDKILYLVGASKAALFYAMIHAIAAIAGKALIVAKVALVISTAIALKKAAEGHGKTTYEIIKHPHHSFIQTHSTAVDYEHKDDHWADEALRRKRFLNSYKKA